MLCRSPGRVTRRAAGSMAARIAAVSSYTPVTAPLSPPTTSRVGTVMRAVLVGIEVPLDRGPDLVREEEGGVADDPVERVLAQAGLDDVPVVGVVDAPQERVSGLGDVTGPDRGHGGSDHLAGQDVAGRTRRVRRGLEQDEPRDEVGVVERRLQSDAAAGGVPDPVGAPDSELSQEPAALAGVVGEGEVRGGDGSWRRSRRGGTGCPGTCRGPARRTSVGTTRRRRRRGQGRG